MAAPRMTTKVPNMSGVPVLSSKEKSHSSKLATTAQRIEAATVKRTQVHMTEIQVRDAEALFTKFDAEGTELLSRGAVVELLREIGLEKALGDGFSATARLSFDAHSADSHFLALPEFKQLYYRIAKENSHLLPRESALTISIMGAKGLPPSDTIGKSDPYCTVQVLGKPHTKSQTRVVEKTLDPVWAEDREFDDNYGYEPGCSLLFEVYDYDRSSKSDDLLGRAILASEEFDRIGGFDGRLELEDSHRGFRPTLRCRVVVNSLPAAPPNLKISIKEAKGLPPADLQGLSDSVCTCMIAGKPYSKASTKVIAKCLEPVWNEDFDDKYRYEEGDSVLFEVFNNHDRGGKLDFLCRATLPSSQFHLPGGFDGWLDLVDGPRGYLSKLHVRVVVLALEPPEPDRIEAATPANDLSAFMD